MNMKRTLLTSAIAGMFLSATAMAAGPTDIYDPYVTVDELSAVQSMKTRTDERMADIYNPYILSHEVEVGEICVNQVSELIGDPFNSYVTLDELKIAEKNSTC